MYDNKNLDDIKNLKVDVVLMDFCALTLLAFLTSRIRPIINVE